MELANLACSLFERRDKGRIEAFERGESGSTLRFMLPVACALGAEATFVGQGRLGARPLSPLSDEIIAAGCDLQGLGGFPLKTSGRMRPGTFVLPGNVSSQYISGLRLYGE